MYHIRVKKAHQKLFLKDQFQRQLQDKVILYTDYTAYKLEWQGISPFLEIFSQFLKTTRREELRKALQNVLPKQTVSAWSHDLRGGGGEIYTFPPR